MTALLPAFLTSAAVIAAGMLLLWGLSVWLRNASIVDIAWGPAFLLVCLASMAVAGPPTPRGALLTVLVAAWSARLALHIGLRNRGKGEDPRYRAMRERRGPAFWWKSLYVVFATQGLLVLLISLPLQWVLVSANPVRVGPLDVAGLVLWGVGFGFEALADAQLAAFKADPASRGQVMDGGLWRYSRHPNYFGEFVLWWGYGLFALGTPGGAWTLVGPAILSFLLLRVSGVALLEQTIVDRRPGYAAYIHRTSSFFPWFPKR